MAKDLIFEIGSEELPARFVGESLAQLEANFKAELKTLNLNYSDISVLGTPRRLAIIIKGLDEKQSDSSAEIKGPNTAAAFDKDNKPTKALEGFLNSQGLKLEDTRRVKTEKGEYIFAIKKIKGRHTVEILPSLLSSAIAKINFPKSMRWGSHDVSYARPMHWLLAVYGGKTIKFDYSHIKSSNETRGHRFVKSGKIKVASTNDYVTKLRKSCVIVDPEERKRAILEEIAAVAKKAGGSIVPDDGLADEVKNLVEYPVVLLGGFDKEFLSLPREVVVNAMREHQRYFSVADKNGLLLPHFVTIANTPTKKPSVVIEGNERVLRARLNDAKFYFEKDLQTPLTKRAEALKGVVFQAKLGTSYEKAERFALLALKIGFTAGYSANPSGIKDLSVFLDKEEFKKGCAGDEKTKKMYLLGRAAMLAKADLCSGMVGEFPKLQGVMGKEYALRSGELKEVANAILEHYMPTTSGGLLPESLEGAIISIADKLDTIAGCFGVGLIPTGAADPYALRRYSIGILSILTDKFKRISLDTLVDHALDGLDRKLIRPRQDVRSEVLEFFKERLKNQMSSQGLGYDTIDAVLSTPWHDIVDAFDRARALEKFKSHEACKRLVVAFKRVSNILKGMPVVMDGPDNSAFKEKEESALFDASQNAAPLIKKHIEERDYEGAFTSLASIKDSIDSFFDKVMVMAEDEKLKTNRLRLLNSVRNLYIRVADLSKLVVSENN